MKTTKKTLMLSVLSMLLCMTMLIGSTFAWFTDTVTAGKNKITAGNLDIELYSVSKNENGEEVAAKIEEDTNLFLEDALWEPGHVEVVNLKVANLGTLALKYQLSINIAEEKKGVNVNNEEFKLSDYIKFAVIEGNVTYADRSEAVKAAESADSMNIADFKQTRKGTLYAEGTVDKNGAELASSEYLTMIVYMPTTVDNVANYLTSDDPGAPDKNQPKIELGIKVDATQKTYEEDSYGNDYDAGATLPAVSLEDLQGALKNGYDITFGSDVECLPNTSLALNGVTVDMAGHSLLNGPTDIFVNGIKDESGALNNRVTIKNGTINFVPTEGNYKPWLTYNIRVTPGGELTLSNVTVNCASQINEDGKERYGTLMYGDSRQFNADANPYEQPIVYNLEAGTVVNGNITVQGAYTTLNIADGVTINGEITVRYGAVVNDNRA